MNLYKEIKYKLFHKKGIFLRKIENNFYEFHQSKLRGSFNEIKDQQKSYIPFIKKIPTQIIKNHQFVDCGCGRGEFLELLSELKVPNFLGIDINEKQIDKIKSKKIKTQKIDVIKFLYKNKKKLSGISAFHLIEHLSYPELMDFLFLCKENIIKKGVLILETPNNDNLIVSSKSFYYDPTHKTKITSELISVLLEFFEFKNIKIIKKNPFRKTINNDIENNLYQGQDLCVIAYRK